MWFAIAAKVAPMHAPKKSDEFLIQVRHTRQGFVASLILGTLEMPARDCKRALWTRPYKTANQALDVLEQKAKACLQPSN
jgi:hypothetical protein